VEKLASFEIDTSVDREKCFLYLSNMDNFHNWFPEVVKIVSKDKEPIGIGKQYLETVKIPLIGYKKITLTVKNFEQYSRFSTEGDLAPLLPRMEVCVSNSSNGQTKINWVFYSRNSSKLFKLFAPLFRYVMTKRASIASVKLKSILISIGTVAGLEQTS
jgi:hypothetical protein